MLLLILITLQGHFSPNLSAIPLENEIVYILSLPNSNIQANVNEVTYYYFQSINIWGSTHHNAIPDPIKETY